MANLVLTPASVVRVSGLAVTKYAGTAITAGQPVYLDAITGKLFPADADFLAAAEAIGIALNAAALDQPCSYLPADGVITIGATVVAGQAYFVSSATGSICLESDLLAGDFPCLVGFATSATAIALTFITAGVAKA